jgi:AcrR family transcriptional regulator
MIKQREHILNSAIKILNGDISAPLDRIADDARISKRTLYRYFEDRETLINACYSHMLEAWHSAMLEAIGKDNDPIKQLEEMLYAAIDCGTKYVFLTALEIRPIDVDELGREKYEAYEQARNKWFDLVPELQGKNIIDAQLSASWIRHLFINTVRTSIEALNSGDVAPNQLKSLAWLSFSRSLGIN